MTKGKGKGWYGESKRHSLSAKGIKTADEKRMIPSHREAAKTRVTEPITESPPVTDGFGTIDASYYDGYGPHPGDDDYPSPWQVSERNLKRYLKGKDMSHEDFYEMIRAKAEEKLKDEYNIPIDDINYHPVEFDKFYTENGFNYCTMRVDSLGLAKMGYDVPEYIEVYIN